MVAGERWWAQLERGPSACDGLPPAAQRLPGVDLLGVAGIDWRRSALKPPGFGRVGVNAVADKTRVRRLALRRGLG